MVEIDDKNFEKEVLSSSLPVVVDAWASWCNPCKMAAPIFAELDKEIGNKIKFVKMDVEENMGLAQTYNINSIPAFLIFKGGDLVKTVVGFLGKDKMKEAIEAAI